MTTHTSKCHAVRHLTMLKNSKSIYIQKYDATYSSPMTIRQQICQSLHCHVILSFFSFLFPLVSLCFLPPSSISFFAQSKKAHLFPRIFLQNHDITHSWSPTSLTAYPNEPPPPSIFSNSNGKPKHSHETATSKGANIWNGNWGERAVGDCADWDRARALTRPGRWMNRLIN